MFLFFFFFREHIIRHLSTDILESFPHVVALTITVASCDWLPAWMQCGRLEQATEARIKLEEASTHRSANTHAGNVSVTHDLDL